MLQLKEELESKEQNDTANHHDGAENETAKQPTLSDGYLDSFNYASTECGAKILASSEKSQVALLRFYLSLRFVINYYLFFVEYGQRT